jgi:hypothetical protein
VKPIKTEAEITIEMTTRVGLSIVTDYFMQIY